MFINQLLVKTLQLRHLLLHCQRKFQSHLMESFLPWNFPIAKGSSGDLSTFPSSTSTKLYMYHKYSKHRPYTVAHTIDCLCSKMINTQVASFFYVWKVVWKLKEGWKKAYNQEKKTSKIFLFSRFYTGRRNDTNKSCLF